jgi:hypothetical protein
MNDKPSTFCAAINKWLDFPSILCYFDKLRIDPPTSFNAVQATDDHCELVVEIIVLVLDFAVVRSDADPFHPPCDEQGCNFRFRLSNVAMAEEKLTVQI